MIKKIHLNRGQILTKDNILTTLRQARLGYDYCKFQMKYGTYIIVAFFKDNTFQVFTNNRSLQLWNEIQIVIRQRGLLMLADYIFRWIQVYNR